MTTDIESPRTTTRQVAEKLMDLTLADKSVVKALAQGYVEGLRAEDVPVVTLRASTLVNAARAVQGAGETRLVLDGWGQGREWVDPGTGEVYEFAGAPGDLEVQDPDALVDALGKAGVPQDEIYRACYKVWKVNQVALSEIAKRRPEWREVVEDHRTRRKPGPPHLTPKEER